jgi:hypothetical protein
MASYANSSPRKCARRSRGVTGTTRLQRSSPSSFVRARRRTRSPHRVLREWLNRMSNALQRTKPPFAPWSRDRATLPFCPTELIRCRNTLRPSRRDARDGNVITAPNQLFFIRFFVIFTNEWHASCLRNPYQTCNRLGNPSEQTTTTHLRAPFDGAADG